MSMRTAHEYAGSEEASGVSTRGIELFAWVRAGGRALGPCAGCDAVAALARGGSSSSLCDVFHVGLTPPRRLADKC